MAYEVTVRGDYFATSPNGDKKKVIKKYEVSCKLPEMEAALSVIVNNLLTPLLQAKYEDFVSYRTHEIAEVKDLDTGRPAPAGRKNIDIMTKKQLVDYISNNNLSVEPECYKTLTDIRQAIRQAEENPVKFQERQKDKLEDIKVKRLLGDLNPGVLTGDLG